ncbi:MAG: redox-sensing transcriptional repressor Rex [bacterium]
MKAKPKMPKVTISRLSAYLRCLHRLEEEGEGYTSSKGIAERLRLNPGQVRKDLSYFGRFGKRGKGYNIERLRNEIIRILGIDREWNAIVVGIGSLGGALARYGGFAKHGFKIVGLFDVNPDKIGAEYQSIKVRHIDEMADFIRENDIKLAIVCVPAESAQNTVDRLVEAGVSGILNFAPTNVLARGNRNTYIRNVDLAMELEYLTYFISAR